MALQTAIKILDHEIQFNDNLDLSPERQRDFIEASVLLNEWESGDSFPESCVDEQVTEINGYSVIRCVDKVSGEASSYRIECEF